MYSSTTDFKIIEKRFLSRQSAYYNDHETLKTGVMFHHRNKLHFKTDSNKKFILNFIKIKISHYGVTVFFYQINTSWVSMRDLYKETLPKIEFACHTRNTK